MIFVSPQDASASRFAANVRARRELREWSQRQLAEAMADLGHSTFRQQTVAEIEQGSRAVKLDEAFSLARALGTSVDNLIRPAGLTAKASELLAAAWEARDAIRQARQWTRQAATARRRLEKALAAADANQTELADELAVARHALAEMERD